MIHDPLQLAPFTQQRVFKVHHIAAYARISFLFPCDNILVCGYTTLCLSIHQSMAIWVIHFGANMNNAAVNSPLGLHHPMVRS